jgi:hypothetical protein
MRPSFGWPTSSVASPAPKTRSGAVLDQLAPARTSVLLTHEQPVGRPDPASATALPTADPTPPGSTSKLVDVGVCRTSLFQKYFLRAVRAGVRTPRVQTVRCTRGRATDSGRAWRIVKVPGWDNKRMGAMAAGPDLTPARGGAAGIRTPDLRRARAALSRLSYGPQSPPATHPPRRREGGRAWTRTRDLGLIRAAL